uniref:Uncharacterized protein n=1 Tax=Magallana gigas TaxID=29159 RepID=K1QCM7_MAGGI
MIIRTISLFEQDVQPFSHLRYRMSDVIVNLSQCRYNAFSSPDLLDIECNGCSIFFSLAIRIGPMIGS